MNEFTRSTYKLFLILIPQTRPAQYLPYRISCGQIEYYGSSHNEWCPSAMNSTINLKDYFI